MIRSMMKMSMSILLQAKSSSLALARDGSVFALRACGYFLRHGAEVDVAEAEVCGVDAD